MVVFAICWIVCGVSSKQLLDQKGKASPGYMLGAVAGPITYFVSWDGGQTSEDA